MTYLQSSNKNITYNIEWLSLEKVVLTQSKAVMKENNKQQNCLVDRTNHNVSDNNLFWWYRKLQMALNIALVFNH